MACRYNVQLLYLIFYSCLQLTLKPVYLMIVVIISCIAFIFLDLCFNNIEAATTTQGSHFSMDKSISCFSLLTGIATAIKNKYNHGERNFNSQLIFSRNKPFMSEANVFLKSEGFLVETIEQHSLDISFNHLSNFLVQVIGQVAKVGDLKHVVLFVMARKLQPMMQDGIKIKFKSIKYQYLKFHGIFVVHKAVVARQEGA